MNEPGRVIKMDTLLYPLTSYLEMGKRDIILLILVLVGVLFFGSAVLALNDENAVDKVSLWKIIVNFLKDKLRFTGLASLYERSLYENIATADVMINQSYPAAGGLDDFPDYIQGPNLLSNPGFEIQDGTMPQNWTGSSAFYLDNTTGHNESNSSFAISNAPDYAFLESGSFSLLLEEGKYYLGGWIKTDLENNSAKGVRFGIKPSYSSSTTGTTLLASVITNWTFYEKFAISVIQNATTLFRIETYGDPNGTAWFDNMELRRELDPYIEFFVLHPNHRGFLFNDSSQLIKTHIEINEPSGTSLNDFWINITIKNMQTNDIVISNLITAQSNFTLLTNASSLPINTSFILNYNLINKSNNQTFFITKDFQIFTLPGSYRKNMTVTFNEDNQFLIRDEPTFILGVYDSGIGYTSTADAWEINFNNYRRLNELPINFYLNYWFSNTPYSSINAMMDALQRRDIMYLQTGNCFNTGYNPDNFKIFNDDEYLTNISKHPGLAGYYVVDECVSDLVRDVHNTTRRLKEYDPDSITFAALIYPNNAKDWRDTVDLLSMDPYPVRNGEPVNGSNLVQVAEWTKITKDAVMDSRPFIQVLQFFGVLGAKWPEYNEIRDMSYMAITEGADGLFYWSLGVNALAYTCTSASDWCPERENHLNDLKKIMWEIKDLEKPLTAIDKPHLLASVNNSNIHTRVKHVDNKTYIFAFNYLNTTQSATFEMNQTITDVLVYSENRILTPSSNNFTDKFGRFEAHVYIIPNENVDFLTLNISQYGYQENNILFKALYKNLSNHITGATCNLFIDGDSHLMNEATDHYRFNLSFINKGFYPYNITCNQINHQTLNITRGFRVKPQIDLDWSKWWVNSTTDLTALNKSELSNLSNVIFGNNFGKIKYLNTLNLSNQRDLRNLISLTHHKIWIDSDILIEFNRAAQIIFFNVTFSDYQVNKDGINCTTCIIDNWDGYNLIVNVTGFSNYTVEDLSTEDCSDGILNQDETGVDCGGVCAACDSGSSGGGGGGLSVSDDVTTNESKLIDDSNVDSSVTSIENTSDYSNKERSDDQGREEKMSDNVWWIWIVFIILVLVGIIVVAFIANKIIKKRNQQKSNKFFCFP